MIRPFHSPNLGRANKMGTMVSNVEDKPTATAHTLVGLSADARERASLCARIADDNRGRNILVLQMKGLVDWVDFIVLVTGSSRRQNVAIANEIETALKVVGDERVNVEGLEVGNWIVLDYADVVIHIFNDEKREYYELEHLWEDAPRIAWERPSEGEGPAASAQIASMI